MIFIRNGFLEKCMADKGFGIYVFSLGKEIHYEVLCAVFWVFWGRRACGFVRVFGGVILIQKEYRFSVGLKVLSCYAYSSHLCVS